MEDIKSLQKRLKVSDNRVFKMIETLLQNGFSKREIAYFTQTGKTYSLAISEIQVDFLNKKKI